MNKKINEHSVQKCRTCLKSSTNTVPLSKIAIGCNPRKTYGQLLKEHALLECNSDFECLMPQYLCLICCRNLRNTYAFVKQAQYCNNKLINVISKQLGCLQEKTIDLPENEAELKTCFEIEKNKYDYDDRQNVGHTKLDELISNDTDIKLESSNEGKTTIDNEDNSERETIDCDQDDSNDLTVECSFTSDNEKAANIKISNEKSPEFQIEEAYEPYMDSGDNLIKHFRTQPDIEDSTRLLHKPKEMFICNICSCKYTNKYTYIYHLKHKHNIDEAKPKEKKKDKVIKCRSCDYTARTYAALNYHTRSRHGSEKDKFKCKFCAYMCLKKFDLLTHVKNSHKQLIKSLKAEAQSKEDQGKTLKNDTTLTPPNLARMHQEVSSDENIDSSSDDVPLIQKITKSRAGSTLNTKMDGKEGFSDEEFIRNILNIKKRFSKSSTKSLARRCDECGNIYKDYKALYAHQRHVHISEDKYSLCPHCGKKYKRKTDLRNHIEKAHIVQNSNEITKQPAKVREKRFMCTECSYVCTTITILNIHINRHHTGEKPYKCDICFKSFIVPYDLKIHRYLHTGERPYKCPICSKGFRDNSHMIKHKRIHNSERPYKCKECNKSFTQSYNLSVHKRTHLREKKLNCGICNKVFENRALLNIHRINEDHHDEVI